MPRGQSDTHRLKTWPGPFDKVWSGEKFHEVRKFDRDYKTGDIVILDEYDPGVVAERHPGGKSPYTGRFIVCQIKSITPPGAFGLPNDIGVFSIIILHCDKK